MSFLQTHISIDNLLKSTIYNCIKNYQESRLLNKEMNPGAEFATMVGKSGTLNSFLNEGTYRKLN